MLVRAEQCNFPPALRVGESVQLNALAVMGAAGNFRVEWGCEASRGIAKGRAENYDSQSLAAKQRDTVTAGHVPVLVVVALFTV
jgi:hypothetical protein